MVSAVAGILVSSVSNSCASGANLEFGEFGHVLILQNVSVRFREDYTLSVRHHPGGNGLRLLHQVGDVARNICWSIGSGPETCQPEYDYPLLAIETGTQ